MRYQRDILDQMATVHTARRPDSPAVARAAAYTHPLVTRQAVLTFAQENEIPARFVRTGWAKLPALARFGPVVSTFQDGGSEVWLLGRTGEVTAWRFTAEGEFTAPRTKRDARRSRWRNEVLVVGGEPPPARAKERFGLGWFVRQAFVRSGVGGWVLLLSLLVTLFTLVMPLFFQLVVDKVLGVRAENTLFALLLFVSAVSALHVVGQLARDRLLNHAAERVDVRLGAWSFRHLLSLPVAFFDPRPAGVLAKHMQQGDQAREFVTRTVVGAGLDLLTVAMFLPVLCLGYSPALGGLVGGVAAAMGVVIGCMVVPFNRRLEALYSAEADRQALLVQAVKSVAGIKAAGAEGEVGGRYERAAAATAEAHRRVMNMSETAQAVVRGLEKALTIAIIGLGVWMCFEKTLSVGQLIATQMLAVHVTGPVLRLVEAVYQFQRVRLAVRMLAGVMDAPPEPLLNGGSGRPELSGEVRMRKVTYRYPGATHPVLEEFDLHVLPGEVVALTGPSGCGKSTVLKLLLGFLVPESGKVEYADTAGRFHDISHLDIRWLRATVGTVLQETAFLSDTVRANLALGHPSATAADLERVAADAGADGFIARLRSDPGEPSEATGFDARLNEGAAGLSGGEKQRLGLARALVGDPPLLFLDEPTAALDAASEQLVVQTLSRLANTSGRTMVVVTHRPALLALPRCVQLRMS